jgi:hypothetical protein
MFAEPVYHPAAGQMKMIQMGKTGIIQRCNIVYHQVTGKQ